MAGLCALNPSTPHGGIPAELRCRFMFKYYDTDNDKVLNTPEFKRLLRDLRCSRGLPADESSVTSEAENLIAVFDIQGDVSTGIPLDNFLNAVGHLRFRGTSSLLRVQSNIKLKKGDEDSGNAAGTMRKRPVTGHRHLLSSAISGKKMHF